MTTTTYMIADGDGNALTSGLDAGLDATRLVAQRIARRLNQSVWVYGPEDTDATATEVEAE